MVGFRLRASDFLNRLLWKRISGAMVPCKRFIKVLYLEKNRLIRLALKDGWL